METSSILSKFAQEVETRLSSFGPATEETVDWLENLHFDYASQMHLASPNETIAPVGHDVIVPLSPLSFAQDDAVKEGDESLSFANDETSVACLPITDKLLLRLSTNQLFGAISVVSAEGEWSIKGRFYDHKGDSIAVGYSFCDGGRFKMDVPKQAHYVDLSLRLQQHSAVELGRNMQVWGLALTEEPLTPTNISEQQNDTSRFFAEHFEDLIKNIPSSNGSSYYDDGNSPKPLVGIITDEFMYNYYSSAFDLVYIHPANYEEILKAHPFDMVLYISCWLGMPNADGTESYDYRPNTSVELVPKIFDFARELGIPCVFQSIEDPPSFNLYLPIAKAADYIFTSAVEVIPRYVEKTGNSQVFYLGYGVSPSIHNPIGFLKKHSLDYEMLNNCVFFAGSWYGGYPERCADTALLFDATVKTFMKQLIIADRTLYFAPPLARRPFPQEYSEFIIPPIDHTSLQKVHKLFDYCINLNTIKDSETMGAMRVYEVQALGSLLISNESKSIVNVFPETCIVKKDASVLNNVIDLPTDQLIDRQISGIRKIFSSHTVYHRINEMFTSMGKPEPFAYRTVTVLAKQITPEVSSTFERQSYPFKRLEPIEAFDSIPDDHYVTVFTGDEADRFILEDAMNAFKFADVDFVSMVGKAHFKGAYDYIEAIPDYAVNTVFRKSSIGSVEELFSKGDSSLTGFATLQSGSSEAMVPKLP